MPLPIMTNKDNGQDYSFLSTFKMPVSNKKIIEASDHDASSLLNIWINGEKIQENTYKVSSMDKVSLNKLQ